MLPIIVFIGAISALFVSLYKDRRIESTNPSVVRALRIHHFVQGILAVLAFWSVIDARHSEKERRIAQLEADAAITATRHFIPIYDQYFLKLVPSANALNNYFKFKNELPDLTPEVIQHGWDHIAPVSLRNQRDNGLKAFSELQKIARTVLSEQAVYNERYPKALANWAKRTLELEEEQLPQILSVSTEAKAYADLTGRGIGFSVGSAQKALKKLEQ